MAFELEGIVQGKHLGAGLQTDTQQKKINVSVDGSTITFNDQGQLVSKAAGAPPVVTKVTELSASQFIQQVNDYSFIELKEKPAFNRGLNQMEISEVTGYKDIVVTGLDNGLIPLNLQQAAAIFPYPYTPETFGIIDVSVDVFEVNSYREKNLKGFAMKNVDVKKEISVSDEGGRAAVYLSVVTSTGGLAKDEQIVLRMQYKVRVFGKYA